MPNLVETVRGYASHEKAVFEKVTQARSMAMQATSPAEMAKAENIFRDTLKSLFAVAEESAMFSAPRRTGGGGDGGGLGGGGFSGGGFGGGGGGSW